MSAINLTIIDRDKHAHVCEAPTDMSMNLMELCKAYELPVEGTCGGMALCASCHVYVQSGEGLPEMGDAEADALEQVINWDEERSRLGCQIPLKDQLLGLVVELAPEE